MKKCFLQCALFYVKQRFISIEILFPNYDLFQGNGSGGFILDRTGSV